MKKSRGIPKIRVFCREKGITYDQFAEEIRKHTIGTPLEGSPSGGYIALLVCGRKKRTSPELAEAIEAAYPDDFRKEELVWPAAEAVGA